MKNYKENNIKSEERKEVAKVDMRFKFRQSMFRLQRHLI